MYSVVGGDQPYCNTLVPVLSFSHLFIPFLLHLCPFFHLQTPWSDIFLSFLRSGPPSLQENLELKKGQKEIQCLVMLEGNLLLATWQAYTGHFFFILIVVRCVCVYIYICSIFFLCINSFGSIWYLIYLSDLIKNL